MSERKPSEKRTVERSDELLQKSRRLIDELEFILEKLDADPHRAALKSHAKRGKNADAARSD